MHDHTGKGGAGMAGLVLGAMVLGGCQGALVGNMVALGVTLALFFGTLSLGRRSVLTPNAPTSATHSVQQ